MAIKAMMAAAVTDGKGSLKVYDVPAPACGDYEAIVRLRFGATCAGTDLGIIKGHHPFPLAYPLILGHESIGEVLEIGKKVRSFHPGDIISRVGTPPVRSLGLGVAWGGFAQYGLATDWRAMERDDMPRDRWEKARVQKIIPPSIDIRDAPMIITWRETLSYARRLGLAPGSCVLVVGSGANALAFVAHFAFEGHRVIALGSGKRAADAIRLGAASAIDYRADDMVERLSEACGNRIDAIVDAIGAPAEVGAALPLLAEDGIVAVYGWRGRADYGISPFAARRSFRVYCGGYDEPETHEEVLRRMAAGALRASDWYDPGQSVPLAEIATAYERLERHEGYKYLIDLE
ncbi:zinc-binding dehydrogenase [bacterium]|nr:zinc-binding dehydrogenase [bacterium]